MTARSHAPSLAVEEAVRAVVAHDDERLATLARDAGDLYGGKHVAVAMWTRQEGRSELTLELQLHREDDGRRQPRILDLHVL